MIMAAAVIRHCCIEGSWVVDTWFDLGLGRATREYLQLRVPEVDTDRPFGSAVAISGCGAACFAVPRGTSVFNGLLFAATGRLIHDRRDDNILRGPYPFRGSLAAGTTGRATSATRSTSGTRPAGAPTGGTSNDVDPGEYRCPAEPRPFVNAGAKPGYTKFTYPHPLRS